MILETDQPFDLELTLRCAQGHRWRQDWRPGGPWYSSVLDGDLVFISQPVGANGLLRFETEADKAKMEAKLRWQFRLDDNIEEIYHYLSEDNTEMRRLIARYRGLRVMRVDPWECLVFFILAVNASIEYTYERMDKIAEKFAEKFEGPTPLANERYPFPKPEDIGLPTGLDQLRELHIPLLSPVTGEPTAGAVVDLTKADYIHEAGKRVHGKNTALDPRDLKFFDLNALHKLGPESSSLVEPSCKDAIRELRKLTGVGAKTAASVALFGLGHLDAFPVDSTILASLKSIYGPQYAGYVSQFLFAFIRDNEDDANKRRR